AKRTVLMLPDDLHPGKTKAPSDIGRPGPSRRSGCAHWQSGPTIVPELHVEFVGHVPASVLAPPSRLHFAKQMPDSPGFSVVHPGMDASPVPVTVAGSWASHTSPFGQATPPVLQRRPQNPALPVLDKQTHASVCVPV